MLSNICREIVQLFCAILAMKCAFACVCTTCRQAFLKAEKAGMRRRRYFQGNTRLYNELSRAFVRRIAIALARRATEAFSRFALQCHWCEASLAAMTPHGTGSKETKHRHNAQNRWRCRFIRNGFVVDRGAMNSSRHITATVVLCRPCAFVQTSL